MSSRKGCVICLPDLSSIFLTGVAVQNSLATSSCWAPTTVAAFYGPLADLRSDANVFCNQFVLGGRKPIVSSAGRYTFGWQSAVFYGNFASPASCLSTFNALVTKCYGTANPKRPIKLGGVRVDPGGAVLVISFGNGITL
ncbi:hypothetical protein CVT25_010588 [Psilocybe cyanescens]|uniref:Uncharacterized protein n=1 Tax=Psilocybe cyanescens TaxID=93625 RepID=A0A409WJC4_PSICY|nr:hypothetical protein CVT25_010588 [Psilocybe cyanescens]